MKQEITGWQWHQLDHMQIICTLLQTDNHNSTSSLKCFTGQMLFLTPNQQYQSTTTPHHNHFTAIFPGPSGWAGARRELLDFMVQGKTNTGRHTNYPTGHHSIRLCSAHLRHPPFLQVGCPSCRPTNSVKALKAPSAFGLGRDSPQRCYLHRLHTFHSI